MNEKPFNPYSTGKTRQVIWQRNNNRIVEGLNGRYYLVQFYRSSNNSWYTEKVCHNDAEAKAYCIKTNKMIAL